MSSAPAGLEVKEYAYACLVVTTPDAVTRFYSTTNVWLITRIQAFAPAALPVFLGLTGQFVPIVAGGCADLEPNGAHRGEVSFGGAAGAVMIIEYWYQAIANGAPPLITVR